MQGVAHVFHAVRELRGVGLQVAGFVAAVGPAVVEDYVVVAEVTEAVGGKKGVQSIFVRGFEV